jgi:hypothetical protein
VLNPSNRIRIPLLPLGKQLDHDQSRNKSAAEGLAIFGLAAIFITQIVLARTFKRGHVLRGLFSVLSFNNFRLELGGISVQVDHGPAVSPTKSCKGKLLVD